MALSVSLAFKQYSDDKLVSFSNTVYQLMLANIVYASLKSYIDDIKVKNDAFIGGIALASRRGSGLADDKNALKQALIKHLVRIANRLEEMAEDDGDNPRIITEAGFEIRNTTRTEKIAVTELEIPSLVARNLDNRSRAAELNWKKVKHAATYAIRYKVKSETAWEEPILNNKGSYLFTTLLPDTVYEFQIRSVGSDGLLSDWSTSIFIYVS